MQVVLWGEGLTGEFAIQAMQLGVRGILASTVGPDAIRLVTHHDVSRGACITAAEALAEEIEAATTARA